MKECIIPIKIETENDVYFGISCNILAYRKKKQFTVDDIVQELKEKYNWGEDVFEKWNIKKMVQASIQNLIEHRKVIEEPRWYELASN